MQDFRKEVRDLKKRGSATVDEAKIKKKYYTRARSEAKAKKDVVWDEEAHKKLVEGEPESLKSKTRITAEQILAIGLPDLTERTLRGQKAVEEERKSRAEEEVRRIKKDLEQREAFRSFGEEEEGSAEERRSWKPACSKPRSKFARPNSGWRRLSFGFWKARSRRRRLAFSTSNA